MPVFPSPEEVWAAENLEPGMLVTEDPIQLPPGIKASEAQLRGQGYCQAQLSSEVIS